MNIRTAFSIALIVFAIGLCFWLFVRPVLVPQPPEIVDEGQLLYLGENKETGEASYFFFKEEIKEWGKILASFTPLLTILIAYLLKRKK